MAIYKYKMVRSVKTLDESKLNVVGRAGWELCGIIQTEFDYIYYLKKQEE
jgi:hypothetical protein